MTDTPEPGTQEAQDAGCTCPRATGWWVYPIVMLRDRDCPLHGIDPDRAREDADERKRLAREDNDG